MLFLTSILFLTFSFINQIFFFHQRSFSSSSMFSTNKFFSSIKQVFHKLIFSMIMKVFSRQSLKILHKNVSTHLVVKGSYIINTNNKLLNVRFCKYLWPLLWMNLLHFSKIFFVFQFIKGYRFKYFKKIQNICLSKHLKAKFGKSK